MWAYFKEKGQPRGSGPERNIMEHETRHLPPRILTACSLRMPAPMVIIASLILVATAGAQDHRFVLAVKGGVATLVGGPPDSARFPIQNNYGVVASYRLTDRWLLSFDLSSYKLYNDVTAASSFSFGGNQENATSVWKAVRIGAATSRLLFSPENVFNAAVGLGGGLMIWKHVDPASDTALKVRGARNETVDYSASEIFVTAVGGIELAFSPRLSLTWNLSADHLTTAGAEFQTGVNSARPRWLIGSSLLLSFSFGPRSPRQQWKSEQSWMSAKTARVQPVDTAADRDSGQVPDETDECPDTPRGIAVDGRVRGVDSDGDGVNDDRDDCPNTESRARGKVDIFGCPVDSDFDGLPDYLDDCPFNRIGAQIDTNGCPIDTDADGIPDGLDDCPNTLYGVEVDRYGCIDLPILDQPLVLHIDYAPGSFEVDPVNLEKIRELARILNFVPDIKLEINGYTDDIGKARANKLLSEKRARRVRDYLVALDVAQHRIKVSGRGETSFLAPNQTAEGRAKNRRVEIVFYR